MNYRSLAIHFMSGTGNSFRAATWIMDTAKRKGMETKLLQIFKGKDALRYEVEPYSLLGIVFPAHGFTAPWNVLRHVFFLPRGRGKHAFVMVSRAGTRIGGKPLPGMEGTAGYLAALMLILKGYVVRGVMGLDMPSNWMSLHWGLNFKNSRFIIIRAYAKVQSFFTKILDGKVMYRGQIPLFIGLILSPLSIGYLVFGRFFLAKLFYASERCSGCGSCADNCPFTAILMRGRDKTRPYWTYSCESCMRCIGYCPEKAVQASHPFAIALVCLTTLPLSLCTMKTVAYFIPIDPYCLFETLLDYVLTLISINIAYLIFFWLIGFRWLNRLVTCLTLTRYYRRYHEPNTSIADIAPERYLLSASDSITLTTPEDSKTDGINLYKGVNP